ncbi:hypothetical protein BU25DRAFT_329054, partial [Macroventuria anomochaeta]
TYDHRMLKTRLPVRSALFKQRTGRSVVRWVTTSEYLLLYVFAFFLRLEGSRSHISLPSLSISLLNSGRNGKWPASGRTHPFATQSRVPQSF